MDITSRRFSFTILLLIIGLATFGYAFIEYQSEATLVQNNNATVIAPGINGTEEKETTTTKPVAKPLTYAQAVNLYNKSRIQFDSQCHAQPTSFTIKSGIKVMLDNRSNTTKTISVDGTKYTLSAYGFRIISVPFTSLPHDAIIDCGSGRNNAQIHIVK